MGRRLPSEELGRDGQWRGGGGAGKAKELARMGEQRVLRREEVGRVKALRGKRPGVFQNLKRSV